MKTILKARRSQNARSSKAALPDWSLYLYIARPTPESDAALRNLKQICETYLAGRYQIEVIDLMKNPRLAREQQIVALPTVIRKRPSPARKMIGDLSNIDRALAGLDLRRSQSDLAGNTSRGI